MKLLNTLTAALLLATLLPAGLTRAADAAPDDAAIHPYLDEGTFFVMRVDMDRVDQAALEKLMNDIADGRGNQVPENFRQQVKENLANDIAQTKAWLTDMNAAGAKRLYVLVDQADQNGPGAGPIAVVPLADGADRHKIEEVLSRHTGGGRQEVQEVGKAMALGSANALERLKNVVDTGRSAQRPDLAPAMAAAVKSAKDGPMWIAYIPGESTRTWIEENMPALPPQLGGGDTKVLSRGVKYAAAGVSQKLAVIAHVTLRAENAESAKSLFDVLNKGLAFVKEATAATELKDEAGKKIEAMIVKLDGDTITLSLDPVFAQNAMMAIVMQRMGGPRPAPAPGAAPAKPDDGGL